MSDATPPDRPPSSAPPPRGWWERLLELGNHNKVIAAASLVTLATGVSYLVVTAVRAVAGGEREIPAEMLDALW